MPEYEKFFSEHGNHVVVSMGSYTESSFSLEELYQAFKARFLTEIGEAAKDAKFPMADPNPEGEK